jgi:hypothetical protein
MKPIYDPNGAAGYHSKEARTYTYDPNHAQRELARFRARHAGDPPPPIPEPVRDHWIFITTVATGRVERLTLRESRRAWRGTRADAELAVERLTRFESRFGNPSRIYTAAKIINDPEAGQ